MKKKQFSYCFAIFQSMEHSFIRKKYEDLLRDVEKKNWGLLSDASRSNKMC